MYDTLEERLGIRIAHGGERGGSGGSSGYNETGGTLGSIFGGRVGGFFGGPVGGVVGSLGGRAIGGYGPAAVDAGVQRGINDASHRANQARGEHAYNGSSYGGFGRSGQR